MSTVRLCVGGSHFVCARSTLLRHSDSFFAKLLSGALPTDRDESGAIFIDRDGTHFRYILNYLRDGSVHLPPDDALRNELLSEANFFQLRPLQLQLEQAASAAAPASRATKMTKVLHVLPSMGSVTNYALSWDANLKTIQQCQAEAQRETEDMVEFVQLGNDCSLSFPLVDREKRDKGSSDKRVNRWFNTRLPLWRRVRELENEGYRLESIMSHPEGGVEYVVLCCDQRPRVDEGAAGGSIAAVRRLQSEVAQLRRELAEQDASRRNLHAAVSSLRGSPSEAAAPSAQGGAEEPPLVAAATSDDEDWRADVPRESLALEQLQSHDSANGHTAGHVIQAGDERNAA